MIVKMIQDVQNEWKHRWRKQQEMFNKDLEELKNQQMNNNWNKKNIPEGIKYITQTSKQ